MEKETEPLLPNKQFLGNTPIREEQVLKNVSFTFCWKSSQGYLSNTLQDKDFGDALGKKKRKPELEVHP